MNSAQAAKAGALILQAVVGVMLAAHFLVGCGGGGGGGGGAPPPTPTGRAAGTVRDLATQQPISGATVAIGGRSDVTGADGSYDIGGIPPGQHVPTCTAPGYTVAGSLPPVRINEGQNQVADIFLVAAADQPPTEPSL